jgi:bifunctional non-homologous end joining protein LigD
MKPMLATLIAEPFDDPDWIFETKWDGYRALAHKNQQVELLSRNEKSFNSRFPEIVEELQKIPARFVLDGEIVILDKKGRSCFQLLQNSRNLGKGEKAYYYVFDLLSYEGNDLRDLPLIERKKILQKFLNLYASKYLRFSDFIEKKGKALFKRAEKEQWEGIIAKQKQSLYSSTRSKNWLKIKTKLRQEVVIGGFTEPRNSRKYFGALLVGIYDKKRLLYVGHVGGGFNEKLLKSIYLQMKKLISEKCPFVSEPHPNTPVTWVKPKLVCEVSFAEWTKEKVMRHPIFQGMRIDKPASKVVQELPLKN